MATKRNRALSNDLTGQTFNQLTVLERAENYITPAGVSHVMYRCECTCGNEVIARATSLRYGSRKSCGCARSTSMKGVNLKDLTGKTFHRWTVIERRPNDIEPSGKAATVWRCRCECGEVKDIRASSLKSGDSKSCGCLKMDSLRKKRDLTGTTVGRWTVRGAAEPTRSKAGRVVYRWSCECTCGTTKDVAEQSLVTGKSTSCGCLRLERLQEVATFVDLSGQRFGKWLVLSRAPDRFYPKNGRAQMWYCRCDCGNENIVAGNMLKPGVSESCGCVFASKAEARIREYLKSTDFSFEQQKRFEGLVGNGGQMLSYDFIVYSKDGSPLCLIECQGEQHVRPIAHFGGVEKFEVQKRHDELKRTYAKSANIPLIELPHTLTSKRRLLDAFLVQFTPLFNVIS